MNSTDLARWARNPHRRRQPARYFLLWVGVVVRRAQAARSVVKIHAHQAGDESPCPFRVMARGISRPLARKCALTPGTRTGCTAKTMLSCHNGTATKTLCIEVANVVRLIRTRA